MVDKRPKKKTAKKPAPPTHRWQAMAVKRGCNTMSEYIDHLLENVLVTWAENDVQKAVPYLYGVLKGVALQVGRLESLIAHSGYAPPQLLHEMCISHISDGYDNMCKIMKDKRDEDGELIQRSLDELVKAISASSVDPRKVPPSETPKENVIALPVFFQKDV